MLTYFLNMIKEERKIYIKNWVKNNKDKVKVTQKKYNKSHPEKIKEMRSRLQKNIGKKPIFI